MNSSKPLKIDFVIPWVDGGDPQWIEDFHKYNTTTKSDDNRENRYRDWGIFKYWFRAVELYAPWVNKIYFVTWGHVPEWLNVNHPKLEIVNHKDYIPSEYLPVFSSHPIELNLHRIASLSEHFIYFNDDTFLSKPIKKEDYFKKGLPCDIAVLNALSGGDIASIIMNNLSILNTHFNKRISLKKNLLKWLNLKYGVKVVRNFLLFSWPNFTGFYSDHQPQPHLKSTLIEVWETGDKKLDLTCANRFRSLSDVNQYLFRYWNLAKGTFFPFMRKSRLFYSTEDELQEIEKSFFSKKYHTICLNDMSQTSSDFDGMKKKIQDILEKVFPEKSQFEK